MINTIEGALNELGQQFVDSLRQELDTKRINASGNLYRSVRYEIVGKGDEIGLALFWDDYGDIVDEGRGRSHKGGPMQTWRNKIKGWMVYKGITPRQGMTQEQLAFLITRKINKKGYKARPWIQPAIDRVVNQDFQKLFEAAVVAEVEKILGKK